jgi:very-short-patch-repair endonuclease
MKPKPTVQVLKLAQALKGKGVKLELEHWDGHKHVDIFIPSARLYIEVNGLKHYTDPKQIIADLKRNHFSDGDDFLTLPITNQLINTHLEEMATAIFAVAKERLL